MVGLSEDEVADLSLECELLYPTMLIPELWAKVIRESERRGMDRPLAEAASAMEALLAESGVRLAPPTSRQMEIAAILRLAGHRDIFDCLGYGAAESMRTNFLSEDGELRDLVSKLRREQDFSSRIISLGELRRWPSRTTEGKLRSLPGR